ncbi:MAG TPA: hypothetical protein VK572_04890 [Burkholderiales bacterium]|nr:hypothetical protein [Burkholderiales bacterium]
MRNKSRRTDREGSTLEFLRGGKTVPEAFIRKRMAYVKRSLTARYEETNGIERQALKYFGQIQKPRPVKDPKAARAMEGLLGIHKKLAKRKLAAPKLAGEVGGILGGSFSVKVVPPFDYAYTIPFLTAGNPSLVGSANKNTGQMSGSAVSDFQNRSFGSMYTEMGIYVRPTFSPSMLRVSASPAFSIEWWTNSLYADSAVRSFGSGLLGIYAQQGEIGPSRGAVSIFDSWDQQATQQIQFDFGSNPHIPVSTQLEVDPSFSCVVFVSTTTHVETVGWPGSLAGSMMSVTLPSITYELDLIPVLDPG